MSDPPLTPMRTGLLRVARDAADGGELLVAPSPRPDVARVDPVLVERVRALRVAGEQQVAVVVEVADERRGDAGVQHPLLDLGHRRGRFRHVDGDPHHVGTGLGQLDALRPVAAASAVSVIVIDWTTTGAPPPTWTGADADADGLVKFENCHGGSNNHTIRHAYGASVRSPALREPATGWT